MFGRPILQCRSYFSTPRVLSSTLPYFEYQAPPLPILDLQTRARRRAKEADRGAHVRANIRLRVAAIGSVTHS